MTSAHWTFGVSDFGGTEPLENAGVILGAGFDFIEPGLAKVAGLSEDAFARALDRLRATNTRVQSMNWFLPPGLRITGPEVDPASQLAFLETALARAKALGARAVVFGSPASRSVPPGFPPEQGREQIAAFCGRCADIIRANGYGLRIGIEHVNHTEGNIINTFAEALDLARQIDLPEVGLTADFYHFAVEDEDPAIVRQAADLVCAVQVADPRGRRFPRRDAEVPGLETFLDHLAAIGYTGGISIEAGKSDDFEDECRDALAYLHTLKEKYP